MGCLYFSVIVIHLLKAETCAAIAQLGERQTEDLKVPGSIPGRGNLSMFCYIIFVGFHPNK